MDSRWACRPNPRYGRARLVPRVRCLQIRDRDDPVCRWRLSAKSGALPPYSVRRPGRSAGCEAYHRPRMVLPGLQTGNTCLPRETRSALAWVVSQSSAPQLGGQPETGGLTLILGKWTQIIECHCRYFSHYAAGLRTKTVSITPRYSVFRPKIT
jgi:hypothetical protein